MKQEQSASWRDENDPLPLEKSLPAPRSVGVQDWAQPSVTAVSVRAGTHCPTHTWTDRAKYSTVHNMLL